MKIKKWLSFWCVLLLIMVTTHPIQAYEAPDIKLNSNSILLYDRNTSTILYETNSNAQMYPASLTKIMTAVVVLEQITDLSNKTTISPPMLAQLQQANASVAGYIAGEQLTIEQLLYGLLLPSGADAANALANYVAGSVNGFVDMMNATAISLGMTNTFFMNPTGLDHPKQLTTAQDMLVLMNYALDFDVFKEIVSTNEYTSVSNKHPNGLPMLSSMLVGKNKESDYYSEFIVGGKTGYTGKAGRCLASFASYQDMELILITLHAPFEGFMKPSLAFYDAREIYDWAFDRFYYATYAKEGDLLETVSIRQAWKSKLDVVWPETITLVLDRYSLDEPRLQLLLEEQYVAPIAQGSLLGEAKIVYDGNTIYETNLLVEKAIAHSNIVQIWQAVIAFLYQIRYVLFALVAFISVAYLIRLRNLSRMNRRRRNQAQLRKKTRYRR